MSNKTKTILCGIADKPVEDRKKHFKYLSAVLPLYLPVHWHTNWTPLLTFTLQWNLNQYTKRNGASI